MSPHIKKVGLKDLPSPPQATVIKAPVIKPVEVDTISELSSNSDISSSADISPGRVYYI